MCSVLLAFVLAVAVSVPTSGLSPDDARQAGRYVEILSASPGNKTAGERLAEIFRAAGAESELIAALKDQASDSATAMQVLASIARAQGDTGLALESFRSAAAMSPDDPSASARLAEFLSSIGRFNEAANVHLDLAGRFEDPRERSNSLRLAGDAFRQDGNHDAALVHWEESVAAFPDDAGLRLRIAEAHIGSANQNAARPHLLWLAENGDSQAKLDARLKLASIDESLGNIHAAIAQLEEVLDLTGTSHWIRPGLSQRLLLLHTRNGTLDEYFDSIEAEAERNPKLWMSVAGAHRAAGSRSRQFAAMQKALAVAPGDPEVVLAAAALEADFGDLDRAKELVEAIQPGGMPDIDLVLTLAEFDVRSGNVDAAETRLAEALAATDRHEDFRERAVRFLLRHRMAAALRKLGLENEMDGDAGSIRRLADSEVSAEEFAAAARRMTEIPFGSADDAIAAAEWLGTNEFFEEAVAVARQAFEMDPGSQAVLTNLAELLTASGQLDEAIAVTLNALDSGVGDPLELDRLLFRLMQSDMATPPDDGTERFADIVGGGQSQGGRVREMLGQLRQALPDPPDPGSLIRLARWEVWSGDTTSASETMQTLIQLVPESADARLLAAGHFSSLGDFETAIMHLEAALALDLSGLDSAESIRIRVAALESERGNHPAAIETLREIVETSANPVEAMMHLASALQRSDDWYGALEVWSSAYELADLEQKSRIRPSLVGASERLGVGNKGIDVHVRFALGQSDEPGAIAAWDDAVDFAARRGLLPALDTAIQELRSREPDAYPLRVAEAACNSAMGKSDEALRQLIEAMPLAADPSSATSRGLDAAMAAGDAAAARVLAIRLADVDPSLANWMRLAEVQRISGAEQAESETWVAIRRRFARDPEALAACAEYFIEAGDSARAFDAMRAAADLSPSDPDIQASAAALAVRLGLRDDAVLLWQRVLGLTKPIESGAAPMPGFDLLVPSESNRAFSIAMHALGGLADATTLELARELSGGAPATGERIGIRLEAIRNLGRLATGGAFRDEWLEWCAAAEDNEAIWGLVECGEIATAMNRLKPLGEGGGVDAARADAAFVSCGLQAGEFALIREWIESEPEQRRRRSELLSLGLSRALQAGRPDLAPADLDLLFPSKRLLATEIWQAAALLALHSKIDAAAKLAAGALEFTTAEDLPGAAMRLASWQVMLGQCDAAVETLEAVPVPAQATFDSQAMAAWRMHFLLLDPGDRSQLAGQVAGDTALSESQRAALEGLFAAISGNDERLEEFAAKLVESWQDEAGVMTISPPLDSLILASIAKLHSWRLHSLALALVRAAGSRDPARTALRGYQGSKFEASLRKAEVTARFLAASPSDAGFLCDRLLGPELSSIELAEIARAVEAGGSPGAAMQIRQVRYGRFPDDPTVLAEMIEDFRHADGPDKAAAALAVLLDSPAIFANDRAFTHHVLRLASLLIEDRDPASAIAVLDRALMIAPGDLNLLEAKDTALDALGKTDVRLDLWDENRNSHPKVAFEKSIALLLDTGRETEAVERIRNARIHGGIHDPELYPLEIEALIRSGDVAEAGRVLGQIVASGAWSVLAPAAARVAEAGGTRAAYSALREGAASAGNAEDRLQCVAAMCAVFGASPGPEEIDRLISAMERLVEDSPTLEPAMFRAIRPLVASEGPAALPAMEKLETAWNEGAGSRYAGEELILHCLENRDENRVDQLLTDFLSLPNPNPRSLETLARLLADKELPLYSGRVWETLASLRPEILSHRFQAARQFWAASERGRALAMIEPLMGARFQDPALHLEFANFFFDIGRFARAGELYSELVAGDPGVSMPGVWQRLAYIKAESGNAGMAELFLRAALLNPGSFLWQPVVHVMGAGGSLADRPPALDPYGLSPRQFDEVRIAVASRLAADGNLAGAFAWFAARLLKYPAGASVLVEMAQASGRWDEADALWQTAIAELPAHRSLTDNYARFLFARADTLKGSLDEREFLERAHKLAPSHLPTVERLHAIQLAAGDISDAAASLRHLIGGYATPEARKRARDLLQAIEYSNREID